MYNLPPSRALAELINLIMNNPSSKDDYIKMALYFADLERSGNEDLIAIAAALIK